ncbi:MAG: hypothetical protein J2P37_33240, partial [Ktedonobacteraceae bacterium]|nr:hypothetical protein [Ktedonobacteraceae bacterium]
ATGEPTTLEPSRDEETLSPTPHAEPPPVVISEQELAQQVEHRVQESEGTEAEQSAARVLRIAMMLEAWEAVSARFDHVPDTARMDAEQQVRRFEEFYAAVQAEALHRTEVIQEVALETTVKMEEGQLIAEQNARAAQDHSLAAQQTTEAAFTNITSQEVQDDQQLSENLNRERTAAYADLTIREVGEERQRITIEHQRKEAADAASDDTNRPPQNN